MTELRPTVIAVMGALCGAAITAFALWDRPADFNGCMLSKMRNEPSQLFNYAFQACGRQFGFPKG